VLHRPLRKYDHPDLSDYVIHFTGRVGSVNDAVEPNIGFMSARGRLFTGILKSGMIRAYPVFYGIDPVVCFTECTRAGVQTLIKERRYAPFGVAFTKDFVFSRGGGPAFYVRADEWAGVRELAPELRARCTKFWPGVDPEQPGESIPAELDLESEWTHEREWRVLGKLWPLAFRFSDEVAFLIVSDWSEANDAYPCVVVDSTTAEIDDPDGAWIS